EETLRVGTAPLRGGIVHELSRDPGPARFAAGAGQSAAGDARLPVVARELRSAAARAGDRRRRCDWRARIDGRAAADIGAAWTVPGRRRSAAVTDARLCADGEGSV